MAVVEVASRGSVISVRNGLLQVGNEGFPLEDLDLVIAHVPAVTITGEALALLGGEGIELVMCDGRRRPVAALVPAATAPVVAARTLRLQAALPTRRAAALWRQVVRAKILAQADLLEEAARPEVQRLQRLAQVVQPGDVDNTEALAARLYWPALFGAAFRRHGPQPPNGVLDFGYAVVRAVVARQLHAAGLHRALGFHHDNAENDGNLADDLIEPFRPAVDRIALGLMSTGAGDLDTAARQTLAAAPDWPVRQGGEWLRLRTAVRRLCLSYRAAVEGGPGRLALPDRIGSAGDARSMAEDVGAGIL